MEHFHTMREIFEMRHFLWRSIFISHRIAALHKSFAHHLRSDEEEFFHLLDGFSFPRQPEEIADGGFIRRPCLCLFFRQPPLAGDWREIAIQRPRHFACLPICLHVAQEEQHHVFRHAIFLPTISTAPFVFHRSHFIVQENFDISCENPCKHSKILVMRFSQVLYFC